MLRTTVAGGCGQEWRRRAISTKDRRSACEQECRGESGGLQRRRLIGAEEDGRVTRMSERYGGSYEAARLSVRTAGLAMRGAAGVAARPAMQVTAIVLALTLSGTAMLGSVCGVQCMVPAQGHACCDGVRTHRMSSSKHSTPLTESLAKHFLSVYLNNARPSNCEPAIMAEALTTVRPPALTAHFPAVASDLPGTSGLTDLRIYTADKGSDPPAYWTSSQLISLRI